VGGQSDEELEPFALVSFEEGDPIGLLGPSLVLELGPLAIADVGAAADGSGLY
jgi:hypothetical protein